MKCTYCRKKLNPYLLKQVVFDKDQKLIFEIECFGCRKYNYVDIGTYFQIRKDFEMPKIEPINNKLPKDLNVMVLSTERCAISWIAFVISNVHEAMFGEPIEWSFEVSRVISTRKRFPIIKGWSNVYNVKPEQLLEKEYDKVLVIQRDFEELKKAHLLYNREDIIYDIYQTGEDDIKKREEAMMKSLKKDYDIVYGREIDDPRYHKVHLEDLNKYTVATFNEVLDFLNFPSHGRPAIVPVSPPHRNWEAYSSILPKGHEICKRLKEIDEKYKK